MRIETVMPDQAPALLFRRPKPLTIMNAGVTTGFGGVTNMVTNTMTNAGALYPATGLSAAARLGLSGTIFPHGDQPDLARLARQLTADRPAECPAWHEACYPLDIDLMHPAYWFHLLTWRHSDPECHATMWQHVTITMPIGIPNPACRLEFFRRRDRAAFLRWWRDYTRRFFVGLSPAVTFLPTPQSGRVRGHLVAQAKDGDAAAQWNIMPVEALLEVLPDWAWIAGHCRRAVWRMPDGWLFSNAAEAAMFVLASPLQAL